MEYTINTCVSSIRKMVVLSGLFNLYKQYDSFRSLLLRERWTLYCSYYILRRIENGGQSFLSACFDGPWLYFILQEVIILLAPFIRLTLPGVGCHYCWISLTPKLVPAHFDWNEWHLVLLTIERFLITKFSTLCDETISSRQTDRCVTNGMETKYT